MAWVDVLMLVDPGWKNHVKKAETAKTHREKQAISISQQFCERFFLVDIKTWTILLFSMAHEQSHLEYHKSLWQFCEWLAIIINVSPTQIYLKYPGASSLTNRKPILGAENGRLAKSPWPHLKHSEKERSDPLAWNIIRDVLGRKLSSPSRSQRCWTHRTATNTTKKHFSGGYPRGTSKKTSISNCPWL